MSNAAETERPAMAVAANAAPSRKRPWIVRIAIAGLLAAMCIGGYMLYDRHQGLERAKRLTVLGRHAEARVQLNRYLSIHNADAEAHLLMAEAFVKDDDSQIPVLERVESAIAHLRQITDDQPSAAAARLQEARLCLLILHRPVRAESLLQKAIELRPDSYDANFLMWKLLAITGRHNLCAPYFWRVYDLSKPADRLPRLRDWFFSEFFPKTASREFDAVLGIQATKQIPVELQRYLLFRDAEADGPQNHAAVAQYFLKSGNPQHAIKMLRRVPDATAAFNDRHYIAVLFETLIALGRFDDAASCFAKWPSPKSGFDYWRCRGIKQEEIDRDYAAAARSYEQARSTWAGRVEWSILSRLINCLRHLKQTDRANQLQQKMTAMTKTVLTEQRLNKLREIAITLQTTGDLLPLAEFYRDLDRNREYRAWKMRSRNSPPEQ